MNKKYLSLVLLGVLISIALSPAAFADDSLGRAQTIWEEAFPNNTIHSEYDPYREDQVIGGLAEITGGVVVTSWGLKSMGEVTYEAVRKSTWWRSYRKPIGKTLVGELLFVDAALRVLSASEDRDPGIFPLFNLNNVATKRVLEDMGIGPTVPNNNQSGN